MRMKTNRLRPKDWSGFHQRNIINEDRAVRADVRAGNIVRFNYSGEKAHIRRPLVFVLHPRFRNKLHGLVLDHISDDLLKKLANITKETITGRLQKLTNLRLPLLKADIQDPRRFYETRLKQFIKTYFPEGESPYRTYNVSGITNMRAIDYRFRDFYINSTGEEER